MDEGEGEDDKEDDKEEGEEEEAEKTEDGGEVEQGEDVAGSAQSWGQLNLQVRLLLMQSASPLCIPVCTSTLRLSVCAASHMYLTPLSCAASCACVCGYACECVCACVCMWVGAYACECVCVCVCVCHPSIGKKMYLPPAAGRPHPPPLATAGCG